MSADIDGAPDEDWMDGLEGGTFVSFSEPVIIEFLQNVPIRRKNTYGKDVWDWDVLLLDEDLHEVGPRILSTASKRLKRALAAHHPLTHSKIHIRRSGEGMKTEYSAQVVDSKGNTKLV